MTATPSLTMSAVINPGIPDNRKSHIRNRNIPVRALKGECKIEWPFGLHTSSARKMVLTNQFMSYLLSPVTLTCCNHENVSSFHEKSQLLWRCVSVANCRGRVTWNRTVSPVRSMLQDKLSTHFEVSEKSNVQAWVSPIPSECSSMAMGIPTFFDRPQTTAFFPKVSMPKSKKETFVKYFTKKASKQLLTFLETYNYYISVSSCSETVPVLFSISMTPDGVAGTMDRRSTQNLPTLTTWKPSTSFSGETWLHTVLSPMCGGTGSCTSKPSTPGSWFSVSICSKRASWVVVHGSLIVSLSIPVAEWAVVTTQFMEFIRCPET